IAEVISELDIGGDAVAQLSKLVQDHAFPVAGRRWEQTFPKCELHCDIPLNGELGVRYCGRYLMQLADHRLCIRREDAEQMLRLDKKRHRRHRRWESDHHVRVLGD